MGINAGAQVAIILLACRPCVVIVDYWDRFCTLGRAPLSKETLPDFYEWCRVTRHPRIFSGLTGCQRTPGFCAITRLLKEIYVTTSTKYVATQIKNKPREKVTTEKREVTTEEATKTGGSVET